MLETNLVDTVKHQEDLRRTVWGKHRRPRIILAVCFLVVGIGLFITFYYTDFRALLGLASGATIIGSILGISASMSLGAPNAGTTPQKTLRCFFKCALDNASPSKGSGTHRLRAFVCVLGSAQDRVMGLDNFALHWDRQIDTLCQELATKPEMRGYGKRRLDTSFKKIDIERVTDDRLKFVVDLGLQLFVEHKQGEKSTFHSGKCYNYMANGELQQLGRRWYLTESTWSGVSVDSQGATPQCKLCKCPLVSSNSSGRVCNFCMAIAALSPFWIFIAPMLLGALYWPLFVLPILGVVFALLVRRRLVRTGHIAVQPSEGIEIGMISPNLASSIVCKTCATAFDSRIGTAKGLLTQDVKTRCPHFCRNCKAWFHPNCIPASSIAGDKLYCPGCVEKHRLISAGFYCRTCDSSAAVGADNYWPNFACSKCGGPVSLAATMFAGKREVLWLILIGMVSLAALIMSLVENFPRPAVYSVGAIACVFALPWLLVVVAVILAVIVQIFTPGGGPTIPLFVWKGGVDGILFSRLQEFEAKSPLGRFAKVYLWLVVNSVVGAVVTLLAFGALYVFMQFVQTQKH
jgi:hypothetical protein